jgi:putative component of membrane protein insertase Oxa1/YidC/SpoIIIJ protein YidD
MQAVGVSVAAAELPVRADLLEYAMEAIELYGAVRGSWMAATRLLRCHPFANGGYDPVQSAERSTDVAKRVGI